MSVGAIECGVDVKYAVEWDRDAATTFLLNHPSVKLYNRDIRSISVSEHFADLQKKQAVILFGGPPCQGFSTSNQRSRSLDNQKNWLFREYMRLVKGISPDWVVFENVKGLVETEGGYFLDAILKEFKSLGYAVNYFILNSADYGVPQNRNRLFIIGSLHGIQVNEPKRIRGARVTVAEAFSDLPVLMNGNSVSNMPYPGPALTRYAKAMRGKLTRCANNLVTNNAKAILERYRHIPQGGNWEDIPTALMGNYRDITRCHTGIYRRLKEDEPSVVIGNYRKNMLIHPWQDRGLSVREAARLQSFPDAFEFRGSIGFQQQQVGNAVPPLLAKAIFQTISLSR